MATLIQAVSAYRPRVNTNRMVDLDELASRLARGTLVTPSIARMVLSDLADELMYLLRTGASVRIPGIGVFRPELRLDGEMHTVIRLDPKLRRNLAHVNDFAGEIEHREVVGIDIDALKARWDGEHPDDPLVLPERKGVLERAAKGGAGAVVAKGRVAAGRSTAGRPAGAASLVDAADAVGAADGPSM